MNKPWLKQYPAGVPAEIDMQRFASLVDMMVAMNPQTWAQDVAEIEPGGYLFYDSTRPLPPGSLRDERTLRPPRVALRAR